jgi:hypothetical protein
VAFSGGWAETIQKQKGVAAMKHFVLSKLHPPPLHRVKVRKTHYRVCLIVSSGLVLVFHYKWPEYEAHMGFMVSLLFAVDPTA